MVEKIKDKDDARRKLSLHLFGAVTAGDLSQVKHLIKIGAQVSFPVKGTEETAISRGAYAGHFDIVKLLFPLDIDPINRAGALCSAVFSNNKEIAYWLIDQGVSPNQGDERGWTALMAAASGNRGDIAQRMLATGANIYARDHRDEDAMFIACKNGAIDFVRVGLAAGFSLKHHIFSSSRIANSSCMDLAVNHDKLLLLFFDQGMTPEDCERTGNKEAMSGLYNYWAISSANTIRHTGDDDFSPGL